MDWNKKTSGKRDTLVYQFTSWYIWWFITVLLLIGVIILAAVSYFLFQRTQQEMETAETRFAQVIEGETGGLQEILDEVLYPEYADYLVEIRINGETVAASEGMEESVEEEKTSQFFWTERLIYQEDEGFFYTGEIPWQSNGEQGTIYMKAELEDETEFLALIFQILLYTGLASLIAGSIWIHRLTKKSLRPLLGITNAVGQIEKSGDIRKRVPVPERPRELNELAAAFNHSLDRIGSQLDREKGFVSDASHELRTPLTAFRGHLNLMKRWGKNDPEVLEQSIEALDHESRRMERMMEQMLLIARNEHIETSKDMIDLTAVIEKVVSQIEVSSQVNKIILLDEGIKVIGDGEQLRQIAVILIENASRYTESGSITIQLTAEKSAVRFSVSDTGIGIPEQDQDRVFERFYRVDKARARQSGGTGLGLSIAKELVQNHHGTIDLESEPGTGSKFIVILPV